MVIAIGIAMFCLIKKLRCCRAKESEGGGQEMQPLNAIGKPLHLKEFRESTALSAPTSEEFENLTSLDIRKNCLPKSTNDGYNFVRAGVPLNRSLFI